METKNLKLWQTMKAVTDQTRTLATLKSLSLDRISPVSPVCYFPHLTAGQLSEHSLPRLDGGQYPGVEVEQGDDGDDGVQQRDRHHHSAGVGQGPAEGGGYNPTGGHFLQNKHLTFNIINY